MKTKFKKPGKKVIIIVSVLLFVCAVGCGVWYYLGHNSSEPVFVYPFQYIGMTEFWGDSQESYGPVTTDKIQTIFLSDTQTVTEVCVKEGDPVKKGDLLMSFDTTLSDLALERERLKVEKLKLDLEDAKKELRKINGMKPMKVPSMEPPEEIDEDLGFSLGDSYWISEQKDYDGSSPDKALICWIQNETTVDDDLLETIREISEEYQNFNAEFGDPSSASEVEDEELPGEDEEDLPGEDDEILPGEDYEILPGEDQAFPEEEGEDIPEDEEDIPEDDEEDLPGEDEEDLPGEDDEDLPGEDDETLPGEETDPPYVPFEVNNYYVVLKVTMGNMSLGQRTVWQGLHVYGSGSDFSFKLFDAVMVPDHMMMDTGDSEMPGIPDMDFGSGFTAAQIAQMRSDQEKKIKDLDFQIKMAEADYKIMQTEVSDGNIYAEIDGTVISVLTEQEAKDTQQPVMKVSGGGGFYVEASVSELEKDRLQIGQEVTINDWRTGMTYTGTVHSIGDFPSQNDSWNGMGNPIASYYPFLVFVDESADLQAYSYVSVTYSAGTSENGVYLENPFIRTENGRSYVMVKGENGKLEQRFVTTGKSLWGSRTEILSGLTAEDLIAFPYGKNVKPGVDVVEGDMSDLYG